MSDWNIHIKAFDRGIPGEIDAEDKFLVEYRDDLGELKARSEYLGLDQFRAYREDRFSALGDREKMSLLRDSSIYPRASVTWFREAGAPDSTATIRKGPLSEGLRYFLTGRKEPSLVEALEQAFWKDVENSLVNELDQVVQREKDPLGLTGFFDGLDREMIRLEPPRLDERTRLENEALYLLLTAE